MAKPIQSLADFLAGNKHHQGVMEKLGIENIEDLDGNLAKYKKAKPSGDLKGHLDKIDDLHKELEKAKEKLGDASKSMKSHHERTIKKLEKKLEKAAAPAHAHLDDLAEQTNKMTKAANKHIEELEKKIEKAGKAEAKTLSKELEKHQERLDKLVEKAQATVDKHRPTIADKTGVAAADSKLTVSGVKEAAKEAAKESKVGVLKRIGGNLSSKGGFAGKLKVGLGALAGGGLFLKGVRDMSGSTGPNGEEVKGNMPVGLAEAVAGIVGGAYIAGLGGGKHVR